MFGAIAKQIFGTANERYLKQLHNRVTDINAMESELEALDDAALQARTNWFKDRLDAGETLDDILIEFGEIGK